MMGDFVGIVGEILRIPSTAAQGDTVCQPITIIGDDIVEDTEYFFVQAEPANTNDMIAGPTNITVLVRDDDGKLEWATM